jgi:Cytochrome c554 and c-prime
MVGSRPPDNPESPGQPPYWQRREQLVDNSLLREGRIRKRLFLITQGSAKRPVRKRLIGISILVVLCVFITRPAWYVESLAENKDPAVPEQTKSDDLYRYMGASSCSGSDCHGNSTARNKLRIGQNEFYIWSQKDRHAKAYEVLTNTDAKIIAKNLKIAKPEDSERCLVCHAVPVSPAHQGTFYDITDSVSCESCHGPAEKWLNPHFRPGFDPQKAASLGMYNTKDLVKRAEKCLECHAGADGKEVTHELIGAGHPRLTFEIDNYTSVMPPHWRPPQERKDREWLSARGWAIGQAVAFRNEIKRLTESRHTGFGRWPDFTHFECFACHHAVVDRLRGVTEKEKSEQIWRKRDYEGKPGRLVWNNSSYAVFRHVVNLAASDEGKHLEQLVSTFQEGLTGKEISHESFNAALSGLFALSDKLVSRVAQFTFTQQSVLSLMKNISGDRRRLTKSEFLAAEQTVLALASLYDGYLETTGAMPESKAIKDAIDVLYNEIQRGWAFNPTEFEATMNKLHGLLSKT